MCKRGVGWDEPLPSDLKPKWDTWLHDLKNLQGIQMPRCFIPENMGRIQKIELHNFSDASSDGYGQCSYIRIVADEQVHCALVMGKARVAPTKVFSIPRLELTAATVSAAVSHVLREELDLKVNQEFFWTDSQVVLGYIKNEARRFHVFVANRVQKIRDSTDPRQWFYVETSQNPADCASRGLKVADLMDSSDREVKVLRTDACVKDSFLERLSRFSDWNTALNIIARIRRLVSRDRSMFISVEEREKAAHALIKAAQREAFEEELKWLSQNPSKLPKNKKKLRRPAEEQRMADLPADRVEPSPPFSYSGIDCFGPFYTKQGRKEFKRQQWHTPRRNVQVGDVVIVKEDNIPRNEWKLARVVETSKDDDGLVRKVKLQMGQSNLGKKGERLAQTSFLERPVQKLVIIVENNS
ncbi:Glycine--tRNA ligase beta subunit [Labeo rohita]|uniref:Glycine--tRNA ligase beta subunit n=1 Tax=Labeo rohita TaxID=84645 RepID=A0ABQ8L8M4_LABRO|nr:Glycine--tRNA ligase beta subunit [Labeo rohita]